MNRLVVATTIVGVLVGALGGFVWWGVPAGRLQAELRDARTSADRMAQELSELRAQKQRFEAQLEATRKDLQSEKEVTSRLHVLVSQGKK